MKSFFLLISLFIVGEVYAQRTYGKVFVEFDVRSDTIFTKVSVSENVPKDTALQQHIVRNINTASLSKEIKKGIYTVVVQFVTDEEGNISDVKPLTTLGYGLEAEVIRTIKKQTKWVPATQSGREVKPYRTSLVKVTDVRDLKKTNLPVSARIVVAITKTRKLQTARSKVYFLSGIPDDDTSWVPKLEQQLNEAVRLDKRAKKGNYYATIELTITKGGIFSNIQCTDHLEEELCKEVLLVLKKQDRWVEGVQNQQTESPAATQPGVAVKEDE